MLKNRGAQKFKTFQVPKQDGEWGRLRVLGGSDHGALYTLHGNKIIVGRGDENDVILSDLKASRQHLEIIYGGEGAVHFRDLGSTHGLWINGLSSRSGVLRNGDKIGLGETVVDFYLTSALSQANKKIETAAQVGTGQSGLTQFIQRPLATTNTGLGKVAGIQKNSAPTKNKESFLEKNKKMLLGLLGLMAFSILVPEVEKKQRLKKNQYLEPELFQAERGLALAPPPVDPKTKETSEIQFKEGFREFRQKNYLRAQFAFETALQIYPDHVLARMYLESTKKEMDEEAKKEFKVARRDEEANRLNSAKNHYESIQRMFFRDQSNPHYKEAEAKLKDLEKKLKGGG